MTIGDFLTFATIALAIVIVTPFLGRYIHRVMEGERVFLSPVVRPVERLIYRVCGIDETVEQGWKGYAVSVLVMAFVAIVAGYIVLRLQDVLPLNQGGIPPMSPDLAFNTSVSFETNTNWQNYSGESGATYLTQAAVLAVRNFTSAATGLAIAIALFRGLTRRSATTLGNYWVDLTRGVLYILLPISIVGAIVLVWQGVPQTWDPTHTVTTLQGAQQNIALGPVASQEWIKELGNNGGGFFNANSAHPFESPTGLTNWLEIFALLICSFALTYTFGRYAARPAPGLGDLRRDGGHPGRRRRSRRCTSSTTATRCSRPRSTRRLGNMEGKEVRFGAAVGGLFMATTTGTSTGAINSWHDSAQPIAGLVPLFNMELGEITPGGIGAGMYGMLVIGAILAVFIAGLMVGRTPEYLGKKVEAFEIKMAMLVALVLGGEHPRVHRDRERAARRPRRSAQPGPARLQRDPVRLLEPDRQQRLGVRRADREHALLQHHRRHRDAHRPLRDDRPDPRAGRLDGRQTSPSRRRSARSRRPVSCSWSCSSASSSSSAR